MSILSLHLRTTTATSKAKRDAFTARRLVALLLHWVRFVLVDAAIFCGDGQFADQLSKDLGPLRVLRPLAVLDILEFGMARHARSVICP